MKGVNAKLPGYRDASTRMEAQAGTLSASQPFSAVSKPAAPPRGKKRRTPKENKRERFFSLRLTSQEHAALLRAAGEVPLGVYIRSKLFDQPLPEYRPRRPRQPVKDHQILIQLLGQLGKARLANNINQLAKAANTGSLPVTPETEEALQTACAEVIAMREALMRALGFREEQGQ